MRATDFDAWARANHGLITYPASGLTNDSWQRAIRNGTLIPIHRHVSRLPGTATTVTQRIAAAVLAAGTGAMASHLSAAFLWGVVDVDVADAFVPDVVIADRRRHPRLVGVSVHRPTDRIHLTPLRRDGIRCTNILRTLCDLGSVAPDSVHAAVGRTLSQRFADIDALTVAAVEHAVQGRPGVPALRTAIDDWAVDGLPADSVLELTFRKLVTRFNLPDVSFHDVIEGWEVDFRFVGTRLVVECDGWSTHGLDREQFERDRHKDLDLVGAGWMVLRLSYRAIVNEPASTARRVRRALAHWSNDPTAHVA